MSGFACPCHSWIHWTTIEPGNNNDGWWTNAKLVAQLKVALKKAEEMHPGCDLLWLFDNSANHHAKEPGGLDVTKINLSDGGVNYPKNFKRGWFMKDGERVEQSMYHPVHEDEEMDNIAVGEEVSVEVGAWRWASQVSLRIGIHREGLGPGQVLCSTSL